MTPRFEVVEAKRFHCGQMARLLRREHMVAMAAAGADPHKELRECFDQSAFRRAWLIDGRLAGLGGVLGTIASGDGMIWLALSEEATRYPVAIIKEARQQLDEIMTWKRGLVASVLDGDKSSLRMAIFLRFHVLGSAWGDPAESHMGRRLLARDIADNADIRMPVGNTFMVPFGYREKDAA